MLSNTVRIKPISTHIEGRTTYFDVFVKHGEERREHVQNVNWEQKSIIDLSAKLKITTV